jgi:hypothetical protein
LWYGDGLSYGYTLGLNVAAAKAASGYNSGVIKLVGDGWVAPSQGYGPYGWIANTMQAAACTLSAQANCPDFIDNAPYMLNYLGSFNTSGSGVATTGAPFLDEWAEVANIDSLTSPPQYSQSMYLNQQYAKANYGVNTLVYEVNESTTSGIAATQLQLDQIDGSVGNALAMAQHVLLMQRDSQVAGPIHVFDLAQPFFGYNCSGSGCVSGTETPLWGANRLMATGPGQAPGAANLDRPLAIALEIINNAIGSNSNLMSITQSGTPTFSYSGGQPQGSSDTILPNSAVPYVNCFSYNNGSFAWTTICFNNSLTTAEPAILAGPGAPTGTVSETVFPGPSNLITDHNEDTYLGASSIAPVVAAPYATTTSGTSYSIPPASMIALTYNVGAALAAPTLSPGTGSYLGNQTVTVTVPSGSTGCIGINTMPTASVPGTCGSGGTTYAGPITVSASETVNAIATEAGSTNSAVAAATFTITVPPAAVPTFSPAAGTYTSTQSVTLSDATAGTTIYYTTNGTTPSTSSSVYSGPINVSASETLEAIAVEAGYTNSPAATAGYTINASSGTTYINLSRSQFTASSFYLNGGAAVTSSGMLQISDGGGGEARSAWFTTEVPVRSFITDFTFQQLNANADGMTFTIQAQGPTAVGWPGGALGYQGTNNSVAVKFDLYNNAGEGVDSTGLYTDGAAPTVPAVDLGSTGINLHSGDIMEAHMVYDGTNLTMTLTDTVTAASVVEVFPVNIPAIVGANTAYVGFTAGTGGLTATQNVLTWSYASP